MFPRDLRLIAFASLLTFLASCLFSFALGNLSRTSLRNSLIGAALSFLLLYLLSRVWPRSDSEEPSDTDTGDHNPG